MGCMAHMSVLVVNLTFGEVYDAPQRAPRSQREKKEERCDGSFSVSS